MSDRPQSVVTKSGGPDPLVGQTIGGRFTIKALIARGGMGKIYRAEQAPLGRLCAVKVLNPTYTGEQDPEFHRRFFLEASIAAKLTHPNTVTVFDYGCTDDGTYYMVMEYLDGKTLHRAIREAKTIPEERALHIARQICRALREAHSIGVIHRDLKPANIFLTEHGDEVDFVKVLDFGLVKDLSTQGQPGEELTQTGLFMGSPKYMSPEQIQGGQVDPRTDVYSLGVILYEMLTGRVPFDRQGSVNVLMAHVNDPVPPMRSVNPNVQVSSLLEAAIMRCLAKVPQERFDSMGSLLGALKQASGLSVTATSQYPAALVESSYPPPSVSLIGTARSSVPIPPPPPLPSEDLIFGAGTSEHIPVAGAPPKRLVDERATPATARPELDAVRTPSRAGRWLVGSVVAVAGIAAVLVSGAFRSGLPPFARSWFGPTEMPPALEPPTRGRIPEPRAAGSSSSSGEPEPAAAPPSPSVPLAESSRNRETAHTFRPSEAPTEQPSSSASSTPPAPNLLKFRIETDPPGVSVRENGAEVCPKTPCDLEWPGGDPSREHTLVFVRNGYRSEIRTVRGGAGLVRLRMAHASTPTGVDPQTPKGFKDIPY